MWLKKKEKLKSAIPLPQMDKWFLPQGQGSSSWFLPFPTYREVLCIWAGSAQLLLRQSGDLARPRASYTWQISSLFKWEVTSPACHQASNFGKQLWRASCTYTCPTQPWHCIKSLNTKHRNTNNNSEFVSFKMTFVLKVLKRRDNDETHGIKNYN